MWDTWSVDAPLLEIRNVILNVARDIVNVIVVYDMDVYIDINWYIKV